MDIKLREFIVCVYVCRYVCVWTRKIFAILGCEYLISYYYAIRVEHSSVFALHILSSEEEPDEGNTRKFKIDGSVQARILMKCFIAVLHLVVVQLLFWLCLLMLVCFVLHPSSNVYIFLAWAKSGCNILQQ